MIIAARRGFPFVRIGLLLIVGAAFASLLHWYVAFGETLADLRQDPATGRRELADHFLRNFLMAGTIPGRLFWGGVGVIALGAVLNMLRPRRQVRPQDD